MHDSGTAGSACPLHAWLLVPGRGFARPAAAQHHRGESARHRVRRQAAGRMWAAARAAALWLLLCRYALARDSDGCPSRHHKMWMLLWW